jgi:hypothetical protein
MSAMVRPSATGGSKTGGLYLRAPGVKVVSEAMLQRRRRAFTAGITRRRCSSGWWLRVVAVLQKTGSERH